MSSHRIGCEACGRGFANETTLFSHQRKHCKQAKRSIREVLTDARAYWTERVTKRVRRDPPTDNQETWDSANGLEQSRSTAESAHSTVQNISEHFSGGQGKDPQSASGFGPASTDPSRSYQHSAPGFLERSVNEGQVTILDNALQVALQHPTPGSSAALCDTPHLRSATNEFALTRVYQNNTPLHDPDAFGALVDSNDEPQHASIQDDEASLASIPAMEPKGALFPYPNRSSLELGDWWEKAPKSRDAFRDLVHIVGHPSFVPADIATTNWDSVRQLLSLPIPSLSSDHTQPDDWVDDTSGDWVTTEIKLQVPLQTGGRGSNVKEYTAGILHHRKLLSVIQERITNPDEHLRRRYRGFKLVWTPPEKPEGTRVYGEIYTSDEFLKAEKDVMNKDLPEEVNTLERVVIALMFWTDVTLLAHFGTASLWPCYLFLGNDSKYCRAKPSLALCSHVAYFESLPASFKDWYRDISGSKPSKDLVTHLGRALFHKQWDILLDDDLLHAMEFGMKILCPDNITRLFFPRMFTYSADYPEKMLIATLRPQGLHPCPRCMIEKCKLHGVGTAEDNEYRRDVRIDNEAYRSLVQSARSYIYDHGYAVGCDRAEKLLKPQSLVPITNAFSKLAPFGFNIFSSLVVDLMHEFELGVWKTLFIHLIRLLEAEDRLSKSSSVDELDRRYRLIPTFGVDGIRRFSSNASEQKRLGARDYEDLLRCAVPAFEGLLPEPHDTVVKALLSGCAEWHALAKLRAHTESTLTLLEEKTVELSQLFIRFSVTTCNAYDTRETSKERRARLRCEAKATTTGPPEPSSSNTTPSQLEKPSGSSAESSGPPIPLSNSSTTGASLAPNNSIGVTAGQQYPSDPVIPFQKHQPVAGRLPRKLNLSTYKYHVLADYASTIRQYGTTDSYTSERGETEHKIPKSWFPRTDKKTYRKQLARIERRKANLRKIRRGMYPWASSKAGKRRKKVAMSIPFVLATSENNPEEVPTLVACRANQRDPALRNFLPDLRLHLLPRLKQVIEDENPQQEPLPADDPSDSSCIVFKGHRIFKHKTIRIRYTTYDLRRVEDIVRDSGDKSNIMVLRSAYPSSSPGTGEEDAHPYRYAKVLKIFHGNVIYVGPGNRDFTPKRLGFLFVRWYKWEGIQTAGSSSHSTASFFPINEPHAFGFVDPADVCRGCHVIPRFSQGMVEDEEGQSLWAGDSNDYRSYFISRVADRDIFMRYLWGLAVGHKYSHGKKCPPDHSSTEHEPPATATSDILSAFFATTSSQDVGEGGDGDLGVAEMVYRHDDLSGSEGSDNEEDEGDGSASDE